MEMKCSEESVFRVAIRTVSVLGMIEAVPEAVSVISKPPVIRKSKGIDFRLTAAELSFTSNPLISRN